jgi:hypothetical protein
MTQRLAVVGVAALTLITAAACGSPDLKALTIVNVISGYHDAGITPDHQNKLVPAVTFQLKNGGTQSYSYVDLALDFWEIGADGPNDSVVVQGIAGKALEPGQTSDSITVHSNVGYRSPAARLDFFSLSTFKGFTVKVFGKFHGRTTPLGELKVEPRLLPSGGPNGDRP